MTSSHTSRAYIQTSFLNTESAVRHFGRSQRVQIPQTKNYQMNSVENCSDIHNKIKN